MPREPPHHHPAFHSETCSRVSKAIIACTETITVEGASVPIREGQRLLERKHAKGKAALGNCLRLEQSVSHEKLSWLIPGPEHNR
eukprot:356188-Chlamydomonas_euryale.AAC.18